MSNFLKFQVKFVCSLVESGVFIIVSNILVIDMEGKGFFQYEMEFLQLEREVQVILDFLDVLLVEKKIN